jgi:hypothetical protein
METWLPVSNFDGYEVSDHGRARSVDRWIVYVDGRQRFYPGQLITPTGPGRFVNVKRVGRFRVCHAVLNAFVGPCPPGLECCHGDDDPDNNALINLRWGTRSDNQHDRVRNGRSVNANKTHCKAGHEFTRENTYLRPQGGRTCRKCLTKWVRESRQRKKR